MKTLDWEFCRSSLNKLTLVHYRFPLASGYCFITLNGGALTETMRPLMDNFIGNWTGGHSTEIKLPALNRDAGPTPFNANLCHFMTSHFDDDYAQY